MRRTSVARCHDDDEHSVTLPISTEVDFSCMIFNRQGDLIGQAEFCPTMLGSCQYAMKWTIEELGLESSSGDVVIHNDPYRGQCHMPEHL